MLKTFINRPLFQHTITALILLNGLTMGLATSRDIMDQYGGIITLIDQIIIGIFTIEILLRITVYRFAFFKDPWSLFDFFVVAISLMPATGQLSILRVLRVLRLFRLLTVIPQMRKIVAALISVIPGIASISMIMLLFFYVFSIMATNLFAEQFPEWFGSLGASMYTLFQVMTLESWSMGIARPVMEVFPLAWIFFIPFILVVTFIMINLVVGVVVDALNTIKEEDAPPSETERLQAQITRLEAKIDALLEERRG